MGWSNSSYQLDELVKRGLQTWRNHMWWSAVWGITCRLPVHNVRFPPIGSSGYTFSVRGWQWRATRVLVRQWWMWLKVVIVAVSWWLKRLEIRGGTGLRSLILILAQCHSPLGNLRRSVFRLAVADDWCKLFRPSCFRIIFVFFSFCERILF